MHRMMIGMTLTALLASSAPLAAQSDSHRFEATGHFATVTSSQFKTTVGVGGRFAWLAIPLVAAEAEITYLPHALEGKDQAFAFSRHQIEGLFGATVGPRLGIVRPFASLRGGFIKFSGASQPLLCATAPPQPLTCLLEYGDTRPALDVGGGADVFPGAHALIHFAASDRMVHYPASREPDGTIHTTSFYGHDFRFAVGAGVRF